MSYHFSIPSLIQATDGTWIAPFLNAKDSGSNLPFDLLDDFSLAAGYIESGCSSQIHVMACVTQATFVLKGKLTVKMRQSGKEAPEILKLVENQTVLTKPGALLQLINESADPCEVLYIVSPPYIFDNDSSGAVLYEDAVMLGENWKSLPTSAVIESQTPFRLAQRNAAILRLRSQKAGLVQ